jgi:hypothetical protein
MQMHGDAKKSLNRKRELGTGSIDPILFVKAYLDTVLSETACAPNHTVLNEFLVFVNVELNTSKFIILIDEN